jgi:hypothetical protein
MLGNFAHFLEFSNIAVIFASRSPQKPAFPGDFAYSGRTPAGALDLVRGKR